MLKKINKKKILILTLILFIYIPLVFAAISYSSSDVVVDNTNNSLSSVYLQDAIDEINYFCGINHPNDYICKSNTPKCIRATTLHTETCTNTITYESCQDSGYALNDIITYGNQTTIPSVLATGDAFDCDVNGDGVYDAATERFYYISDYFDTKRKRFNDTVAVLIYYKVIETIAYDCSGVNNNGPISVLETLPTTAEWSNIRLYNDSRQILTAIDETSIPAGTLPSNFSYKGHSARLLAHQELEYGCYDYKTNLGGYGALDKCNFLFEYSLYSNPDFLRASTLLETPYSYNTFGVYDLSSRSRRVEYSPVGIGGGIRPVIEIQKTDISY